MARVLLFPDAASLEPCGRATLLARALAARGHEPILAGAAGHLDDNALLSGAEVARYALNPSALAGRLERWDEDEDEDGLADLFARELAGDIEALERLAPDFVVVDQRPTTALAAEIVGAPCASIVEAGRWPQLLEPPGEAELESLLSPAVRRTVAQLQSDATWTPELRVRLPPALRARLAELGAATRTYLDELGRADSHLLVEHPHVWPLRAAPLPEDVHTVGPLLYDLAVRPPWFWPQLSTERPVVTVFLDERLGSVAASIFLEPLADLDAQIVVVGPTRPACLGPALWCRRLPFPAAFGRSDLVVCMGQPRVIYGALLCGAPLVVVPNDLPSAMRARGLAQDDRAIVVPHARAFTPAFAATIAARLGRARAPALATDARRSLLACIGAIEGLA